MTTVDAVPNGVYRFVGPGPHILNLPPSAASGHGAVVTMGSATDVPVDLTINADGTDQIRDLSGVAVSSTKLALVKQTFRLCLQDDTDLTEWFALFDVGVPTIATGSMSNAPLALSETTDSVEWTYFGGDDDIVTFDPGGLITINHGLPARALKISAEMYVNASLSGNNGDVNWQAAFTQVTGAASTVNIGDGGSIGSSRAYSELSRLSPLMFIDEVVAGNQYRLDVQIGDRSSGAQDATITAGIVAIEVV